MDHDVIRFICDQQVNSTGVMAIKAMAITEGITKGTTKDTVEVVTAVDTIIITLTKDINNPHPSRTCKITRISSFLSNSFLIFQTLRMYLRNKPKGLLKNIRRR
jgi:hypothetical protein